jgi:putative inorganic carbon (hco3(-)) transporter
MATLEQTASRQFGFDVLAWAIRLALQPLQTLLAATPILYIALMVFMLFHPPDYRFPPYDRFIFLLLVFVVLLRICLLQNPLRIGKPVVLPMFGLVILALCGVLVQPYNPEIWSMFAAKWFLPFALFLLAGHVFETSSSLRQLEIFSLCVLSYLSLIAIFFLIGAKDLIFPRYILDESFGIHADRARGPFLQAVANGVALNVLGLVALDSFRRKRLRGPLAILFLAALPAAILATRTRAIWLSFAASILACPLFTGNTRQRRACLAIAIIGLVSLVSYVTFGDGHRPLSDRLAESDPVRFRLAVYQAGWEMFLQKPLNGWGAQAMQTELSSRITEFRQEQYVFHNTCLEVLVQYGLVGLALYLWLVVDLFRIGHKPRNHSSLTDSAFLDLEFRTLWPVILMVYVVNSMFVVMNYQFVNGYLFTLAGLLAAQNRQLRETADA